MLQCNVSDVILEWDRTRESQGRVVSTLSISGIALLPLVRQANKGSRLCPIRPTKINVEHFKHDPWRDSDSAWKKRQSFFSVTIHATISFNCELLPFN